MPKDKNTTRKAEPAGQDTSANDSAKVVKLPCRVIENGMLYQDAHHGVGKVMSIPKEDAEELKAQGCVEILPGLA